MSTDESGLAIRYRAGLALGLALVILGVFVSAVGWEGVADAIYRTDPLVYLGAFVSMTGCLLCRSLVWHRILSLVDEPRPYWLTGGVFLTAMFTKYVIPYGQLTSGVGIAAIINRYYEIKYEEALAGVASADFLNYLPYYTFGAIGAGYVIIAYSPPIAELGPYAALLALLVVVVVVVVTLLWRRRELVSESLIGVTEMIRRGFKRVTNRDVSGLKPENVRRRFRGFYATVDLVTKNKRTVGIAFVFAHLGWLGLAGALYLTTLAIGTRISLGMALLIVAVSKFGFLVPTPGGVGGVELALATALYLLTPIGFATTTAIALLWRLSTYWFTVGVGGAAAMAMTLKDPVPPDG